MKKSNKVSIFYILSSVTLLLVLVVGGCYGIYLSVGLSFVRNGVSNITNNGAMNVSFGGSINFSYSMVGVILLSIALIVLAVLDFVSLIKQIILFKQFKVFNNLDTEKTIEKKATKKTKVLFFAFLIDTLSFIVGIAGVFLNMKTFPSGSTSWPLNLIDILVSLLSLASIVLLIIKLRTIKKDREISENTSKEKTQNYNNISENTVNYNEKLIDFMDIDEIEYKLLKLRQLKNSKVISQNEYEVLRNSVINSNKLDIDLMEEIENKNTSS